MMGSLFIKECKQVLKSIVYLAFAGIIILFYVSQLGDFVGRDIKETQEMRTQEEIGNSHGKNPLLKPVEGQEDYGFKNAEIPSQVMPDAVNSLLMEYTNNRYTTYPLFYKEVKLNGEEQLEVKEILYEITGLTPEENFKLIEENIKKQGSNGDEVVMNQNNEEVIPIIVTYDVFKEKMKTLDTLLGGKSNYKESNLKDFGKAPITYEESMKNYETFINVEKLTGPYARLFCDYMGIVIGLFSVFVTLSYLMRDRKSKMNALIYSRKITSIKLIILRYLALIVMMLIPFVLLSMIPLGQLMGYGIANDLPVDSLGFIKAIFGLLLPTLMITTALGFFLTMLTDTPIAIGVQFLWGFLGLNAGVEHIYGGDYGLDLMIRHNTLNSYGLMQESLSVLIVNRVFYMVLALVIMGATVFIYEQKRKGRIDVMGWFKKMFGNRKSANRINHTA